MDEHYLRIKPDFSIVKTLENWQTRYQTEGDKFVEISGMDFLQFLDSLQSTVLEMVIKKQATRVEANNEPFWQFVSEFTKAIRDKVILPGEHWSKREREIVSRMTTAYRKIYRRRVERLFKNESTDFNFDTAYYREGQDSKIAKFVTLLVSIGNNILFGHIATDNIEEAYRQLSCLCYLRNAFLSTPCDLVQLLLLHFNLSFIVASLHKFVEAYNHLYQCFKLADYIIDIYRENDWLPRPMDLHHMLFHSGDMHPVLTIFPHIDYPNIPDIKRGLVAMVYLIAKDSGTPLRRPMSYELSLKNGYYEWLDWQFLTDAGKVELV